MLKALMSRAARNTESAADRELLASVRADVMPDPVALRRELADLERQIHAAEQEWRDLERRTDDCAFLARRPVAERLAALRERARPLPITIATAERRRAAFLKLAHLFDSLGAEVTARLHSLMEHPPCVRHAREEQVRALDQVTRIHVRLAGRLGAISTHKTFQREPPDALHLLRDDLEARIHELDHLRVPGHKPALTWPPHLRALLDDAEDRTARKDIA